MIEKIEKTLVGVSPLLMHNVRLADPTCPITKELHALNKKRNKTEEDRLAVRKLEWLAGLYQDADGRIAIPSDNVLALVIHGARKSKLGKDAQAGVFEVQPFYPLIYKGPADPIKLYETSGFVDYRAVSLKGVKIMRARPRFQEWKLPIQIAVNTDVINPDDVERALEKCGQVIGLGDYRPRYGRFDVA